MLYNFIYNLFSLASVLLFLSSSEFSAYCLSLLYVLSTHSFNLHNIPCEVGFYHHHFHFIAEETMVCRLNNLQSQDLNSGSLVLEFTITHYVT